MTPNHRRRVLPALLAAPLMILLACSDLFGPEAVAELRWEIDSLVIPKGESFAILVAVNNPTARRLRMTSACGGVLYRIHSLDESAELTGVQQPCLTYIKGLELPAGGRAFRHEVASRGVRGPGTGTARPSGSHFLLPSLTGPALAGIPSEAPVDAP